MKTIPCPHCGKPISPAQILGKLSRGRKKKFSADELAKRAARLPHPLNWKQPNCGRCRDLGWIMEQLASGGYTRVACPDCAKGRDLRELRAQNEIQ